MQESTAAAAKTDVPVADEEPPLLIELELQFDAPTSCLSRKLDGLAK